MSSFMAALLGTLPLHRHENILAPLLYTFRFLRWRALLLIHSRVCACVLQIYMCPYLPKIIATTGVLFNAAGYCFSCIRPHLFYFYFFCIFFLILFGLVVFLFCCFYIFVYFMGLCFWWQVVYCPGLS